MCPDIFDVWIKIFLHAIYTSIIHPPITIHPSICLLVQTQCHIAQLSESLFHITVSLEGTLCWLSNGFWCPVAPDGDRSGRFHFHHQTTLVSHAGGIFSARSDWRSQCVHMFPQTLLWSTLSLTGSQKVLLRHLHGLGWGALEPSCPSECQKGLQK